MSPTTAPLPVQPIAFSPAEASPDPRCEVCGHPSAHHDLIARRYCAATLVNALPRGCICADHEV